MTKESACTHVCSAGQNTDAGLLSSCSSAIHHHRKEQHIKLQTRASEGDLAKLTNLGFSRDDVGKALGTLTSNDHNHHNLDSVADWLCQNLNDGNVDSVEEIDGPILGGRG